MLSNQWEEHIQSNRKWDQEKNGVFTTRKQVVIKSAESSVPRAHYTHLTINWAKLKEPNTKCWEKTGRDLTRNLFTADHNATWYNHFQNHCIFSLSWSCISLSSGPGSPPNYIIKKKIHVRSRDMCQDIKSRMCYARHWNNPTSTSRKTDGCSVSTWSNIRER